ncbi:MAG: hypothetical protein M1812_000771 [Candelaria pacifica]|nr:MAG: hypothetical protein M1812_000771 [Candelaria pacifica]
MSSPMDWRHDTPPTLKRSIDQFREGELIQDRRVTHYDITGAVPTQTRYTTYDKSGPYNSYSMYQDPQPVPAVRLLNNVFNGIIGGILATVNFGRWAGCSVLQGSCYLGRSLYRSRRIRQTCSNTYIIAVAAGDGAKRRAVQYFHPITVWQERQQIHRASLRLSSSSPRRSPYPSSRKPSPKITSTSPDPLPSRHNIPFSTTSSKRQARQDSTIPNPESQAVVRPDNSRDAYEVRHLVASASPINIHQPSPPIGTFSPPPPVDIEPQSPPLGKNPLDFLRPHIPENAEFDRIVRKAHEMDLLMKQIDEEHEARMQEEEEREAQKQVEAERKIQRQIEEKREASRQESQRAEPIAEALDVSSDDGQEPNDTQVEPSVSSIRRHSPQHGLGLEEPTAIFPALRLLKSVSPHMRDVSKLTALPRRIGDGKIKKTPRRVAWKNCPNTGMPTDNVREYFKGEAMDYIPSSSPFGHSPLAMKQAADSASSLEDRIAALGPASLREQAHLLTEPITYTHNQPPGTSSNEKFADVADEGMDAVSESGSRGGRAFSTRKRLGEIQNNSVTPGRLRRTSRNDAAGLLGSNSPIGAGPPLAHGKTRGATPSASKYARKPRKTADRIVMATPTPASRHGGGGANSTMEGESSTEGRGNKSNNQAHDNRAFEVFEETFGLLSVSKRTRAAREAAKQKLEAERKEKAEREIREREEREAAEEAQRLAEEEAETKKRLGRAIPKEKLITPLNAHWEAKVDEIMALPYEKLELAPVSNGSNLGRKDFGTLLPIGGVDRAGGWLNDEIVNGYLQTVVDAGLKKTQSGKEYPQTTPKYHAFSTFFYKKLRDEGPTPLLRWSSRAKVGGQRLLETERIFIPIHESSHWTLLVVSPTHKTIEYFDSLNGSPTRFVEKIKIWLRAELGSSYLDDEWLVLDSKSPQQDNGLDCGVFAATTAKMILMGVDPLAYGPEDIPIQRRRMVAELLNGGFQGDFAL